VTFRNKLIFYGDELLAPLSNHKPEDHPLSAVRDCLFDIFAATLHTWRPSPPSETCGRAMSWCQGTHLTWSEYSRDLIMPFAVLGPCSRTGGYQHFGGTSYLHLQGSSITRMHSGFTDVLQGRWVLTPGEGGSLDW
jgi:hypothetical protein